MDVQSQADHIIDCTLPDSLKKAVKEVDHCIDEIMERARKRFGSEAIGIYVGCPRQREIMENAGADFAGRGVERDVYSWDDCVVKLPHSRGDRWVNRDEAFVWDTMPDNIRDLFVPVDELGPEGSYLTMPKAKTKEYSDEELHDASVKLNNELRDKGYECTDIHPGNVGYYRGKWRILDYSRGVFECLLNTEESTKSPMSP